MKYAASGVLHGKYRALRNMMQMYGKRGTT